MIMDVRLFTLHDNKLETNMTVHLIDVHKKFSWICSTDFVNPCLCLVNLIFVLATDGKTVQNL